MHERSLASKAVGGGAILAIATAIANAIFGLLPAEIATPDNQTWLIGGISVVIAGLAHSVKAFLKGKVTGTALAKFLCLVALPGAFIAGGCATTAQSFSETLTDGSHTKYTQVNMATIGSKLQEGSGDMKYQGEGKNPWKLSIGNAAKGLEGYDPTQVLLQGLQLGAGLATGNVGAVIPKPQPATTEFPELDLSVP